jgi:hypothetical protein
MAAIRRDEHSGAGLSIRRSCCTHNGCEGFAGSIFAQASEHQFQARIQSNVESAVRKDYRSAPEN